MNHEVLKRATTPAAMQAAEVKRKIEMFVKDKYTKAQLNYFSQRAVRQEAKLVMVADPAFMERFGDTYNVYMLRVIVGEVLLNYYNAMMRTASGRRSLLTAIAPAELSLSTRGAVMNGSMQPASPRVRVPAPSVVFMAPHKG